MDANGTHYHLLLGYDDWAGCADADARVKLRNAWERALSPPDDSPPQGEETALAWDAARHELTLQPELFNFVASEGDAAPALERRRGGARDRYGNWYWIDETRRGVRVNSAGSKLTSPFWPLPGSTVCAVEKEAGAFEPKDPAPPPAPQAFSGLAVTEDHYLVVGTLAPAGLLIFDLHAGGAPQQVLWPAEVEFTPFDMAARPGGGVWILDRERKRYWALDRHFNVISLGGGDATETTEPEDFKPLLPPAAPTGQRRGLRRPPRITAALAAPLDVDDPISIESLPDCSVLILNLRPDWPFSRIHRYFGAQELGRPVSTIAIIRLIELAQRRTFRLVGYDLAFVARHEGAQGTVPDRLYIVEAAGNQAFAFNLTWRPAREVEDPSKERIRLDPVAEFLPLRLFGGKGLNAAGTEAFYDFGDGWIPLAEQRRPRYATAAALVTPPFDGREPDCVWHRLMLDACIPPETGVRVSTRAANDLTELSSAGWLTEPRPYLRGDGSELPFVRTQQAPSAQAGVDGVLASTLTDEASKALADKERKAGRGTWELLFQRARGRYLQIKIELRGNQRTTPRLRALRAYYPRFSYLNQYLPAVYREDAQSASFLDRFLANFEGLYTSLESKIAAVQMLFDVRSAPPDVLAWLASWFGVALDPAWDETRRRLFIKHAMLFFQYRGTMRGLEMALSLVLDECVDESVFTQQNPAERGGRLRGVRLTEKFRTRPAAQPLTSAASVQGPRLLTEADVRTPLAKTAAGLQRKQLAATLRQFALPEQGGAFLPLGNAALKQSTTWRAAAQAQLGFVPVAADADRGAWQDFLARRYRRVGALNAAHQTNWLSFAAVPLPSELPAAGPALQDWYDFESVVLAMRRTAHRFTVLLPVRRTDSVDADAQQRRRALTERIVNLEKPAHTIFDVKFYWAMFRVGEARLGSDTLIDLGSRAPELMPPMVLGREHLAEAYLAPGHPQNVQERFVVGREQRPGSV